MDEEIVVEAETVPLVDASVDPMNSGFTWYKPPPSFEKAHTTAGHSWTISGHDMQILTSTVPAGEAIETEVGSFVFMHPAMTTKVELTMCARGGCTEGWSRICSGESCVKVFLNNDSSEEGYVGLTPNYPAKIIPIKFGVNADSNSSIVAQPGSYMTQLGNVKIGYEVDCSPRTCCCAGFGLCRQTLSGPSNSIVFVSAGGTVVTKELNANEVVVVDSRSVLAYASGVSLGVTPNGKCCTCCCGGEGCCSTTLTGPGKVWMQSLNFQKFKEAVQVTVYEDEMDRGAVDVNVA